jgi:hypothetical protein
MPHFQLVTGNGDALGPLELPRAEWPDGAVIAESVDQSLRVIGRYETEDPDDPEDFHVLFVDVVASRLSLPQG